MKTKNENRKMNFGEVIFITIVTMMLISPALSAQESEQPRTLLKPGLSVSELWVPEMKVNRIQGDVGTLIGFYGGRLIENKLLLGVSGGVNLTHPRVNYGYFGGICQYIFFPEKVVHFSTQVLVAYGTAKDYEDPKVGLLDNFWNISGEDFMITEPGINLEINLTDKLAFVAGMSYRFVNNLDENNENLSITRVTYKQMSGLNFNIGLKFRKELKK
jgi:hypothetical protein